MATYTIADTGNAVTNMTNAQNRLNTMVAGDILRLTAGANYDGTLTLPSKALGLADITITTTGTLPAAGTRVAIADAAQMPKLRVIVNNASAIKTCNPSAGVANGYKLIGLEVIGNAFGGGSLIDFGSGNSLLANKQDTAAKVPGFLTLDRCYVHGLDTSIGTKRGLSLHCHDAVVKECYISNCALVGQDTQAIFGANGIGGYLIVNCYLEAAGENVLMGGQDPIIPGLVPSGLTITRCDFDKPVWWRTDVVTRQVKNLLEFKNFANAHVYGNLFQHTWSPAQHYAIVFTPANSDGTNNATVVRDILFEYNTIRFAPGGVNISSHDAGAHNFVSDRTRNITIRHNLFRDIGTAWGSSVREMATTSGSLVNVWEGVLNLTIEHNTLISSGNSASVYFSENSTTLGPPKHTNFIYRNNLQRRLGVGVSGSGLGEGSVALQGYAPGYVFTKNVLAGGTASRYPAGNFFPTEAAFQATFTNYAGGDFSLAPSSPYNNAATDGTDIGADIAGIIAAYGATTPPPPPCTYVVAPTSVTVSAAGVSGTLLVTTQTACAWTGVSNNGHITVTSGASGTGNGNVGYTVAANVSTSPRVGTLTVAGKTVTITQNGADVPPPPPCEYTVFPTVFSSNATGGNTSTDVATGSECEWVAVGNVSWLVVDDPDPSAGSGTAGFTILQNGGASARTGTLTVAGTTVTVTQDAPVVYTFTVTPTTIAADDLGVSGTITVTTQAGGAWTAVSNAVWITVTSGASGISSGSVGYTVALNSGGTRVGTLTVAGKTVTVTQEAAPPPPPPCLYDVSPGVIRKDSTADSYTLAVTTTGVCPWTAISNDAWITVDAGASGAGSGTVDISVAANVSTVSARIGTLTVAGETITVEQAEAPVTPPACTYDIDQNTIIRNAQAGSYTVAVTTSPGCVWTAVADDSWLHVSVPGGTGSGTVGLTVDANPSTVSGRTGTATIAGKTLTVTQAKACVFAVDEPEFVVNEFAATGLEVAVTSGTGCAWTAVSQSAFITVTGGASGEGDGTVTFSVAVNTGGSRIGTLIVAGHTITVAQAATTPPAFCSYSVSTTSVVVGREGGTGSIAVDTQDGCEWEAVSSVGWVVIVSGSGTGDGSVTFTVDPATEEVRTGTITVAGLVVTISQRSRAAFTWADCNN